MRLEDLARGEIERREMAEQSLAEMADRLRLIEDLARAEIHRREAAERAVAELTETADARAADLDMKLRAANAKLDEARERLAEEAARYECLAQEWTARVAAVEAANALQTESLRYQLESVTRQLQAVLNSSAWRATWPVRRVGARMPPPIRRVLAKAAKVAWRTLNAPRKRVGRIAHAAIAPSASRTGLLATPSQPADGASSSSKPTRGLFPSAYLPGFSEPVILRAVERLGRFSPFVAEEYRRLNLDIMQDGIDPAVHAICFGAFERRRLLVPEEIARGLGKPAEPTAPATMAPIARTAARIGRVSVYVSSRGNIFMREIADDLVRDFRDHGVAADLRDETSSPEDRAAVSIFVAPHEFFALGQGVGWVREDILASGFMFGTEQVQTKWFSEALPLLLLSRGVIDMSPQIARLFRDASVPALHHLPNSDLTPPVLGEADKQHRLFRALPPEAKHPPDVDKPFHDRPIDIAFFGTQSPRRDRFFARNAAFLAEYNNYLYLRPETAGPIRPEGGDTSLTNLARHVSGHAKITLNIHRDEYSYFEWHRIVRIGMAAGSLVVTDPCLRPTYFEPGVHYLEEAPRQMPNLLDWLLRSDEGRAEAERVRSNAVAAIIDADAATRNVATLCAFLLDNAET